MRNDSKTVAQQDKRTNAFICFSVIIRADAILTELYKCLKKLVQLF